MPSLHYYLNGRGSVRSIYVEYSAKDGRLQMSTGIRIEVEKFKQKVPADIRAVMRRLETEIDVYESDCRQSGRMTERQVARGLLCAVLGKLPAAQEVRTQSLWAFVGVLLDDMESGRVLNNGRRYSKAFVKLGHTVARKLKISPVAEVAAAAIDEEQLRMLALHWTQAELSKNTVSTYLGVLSSFINSGRNIGQLAGDRLKGHAYRVQPETIDHGVYLNEDEMHTVAQLKLDGTNARYRDAFLFGCCIGLRYSDLVRITPQNRRENLININTQKTSTPVWAPLNSMARELWDRYLGYFDLPGDTQFRILVRQFCKDAGIDRDVLFSRTEGGRKVERWVRKWELIGTHTMRRSFATNAFKAGVAEKSIMKITGHKSYESFSKYVRLSNEEHAELVANHPHFR